MRGATGWPIPGRLRDDRAATLAVAALVLLARPRPGGRDDRRRPRGAQADGAALGFSFAEVAEAAGLTAKTVFGGQKTNRYLLETTGSGVAVLDYDGDDWLDVFVVNGTTLEGFPKGQEPTSHLYRNRRDGSFEDVTAKAGLVLTGWGQGACAGDYDNDGDDDLFVTYWGQNRLYRNRGNGTLRRGRARARAWPARAPRWGAGCAFLDFDRDGRLDLFAANYIDFNLADAPVPESGLCRYKGVPVACGPPGLRGGKNLLYRNAGDGTFADVSGRGRHHARRAAPTAWASARSISTTTGGWMCMSRTIRIRARCTGTIATARLPISPWRSGCAYSQDGKPQAGMGVAVGDYNRDGRMDIFKTNFAGDTSTLYANAGGGLCEDRTFAAGIGMNTRWLGWGVGFVDLDRDGWLDLFLVNGHVYPEVEQLKSEAGYKQRKVVYRNLAQRTVRRHHRAARPAGHDPSGRPRRRLRRSRQRRRHRHRRQQHARQAGSVPAGFHERSTLADA